MTDKFVKIKWQIIWDKIFFIMFGYFSVNWTNESSRNGLETGGNEWNHYFFIIIIWMINKRIEWGFINLV